MILESVQIEKRFFDPKSKQDMAAARHFFKEMAWGNPCPFFLEYPYESVPSMIKDKIVYHALDIPFDNFHHIGD